MLKSGSIYKLGEGPINYNWNLRYAVLDQDNQELTYYQNENENKPNGIIQLADALISNITLIKERDHSFSIQTAPPNGKTFFLSCNSQEESVQWREAIIAASTKHKQHMAQASFKDQAKERFSMPRDQQQRWKNDDVFLDENQIFNEDANYFEITQPLRKTFGAGQMKNASFFGDTGARDSPDQPLRISRLQVTPKKIMTSEEKSKSLEYKQDAAKTAQEMRKSLYNKSKVNARLDIGQMNKDQATYLKRLQGFLQEDSGQSQSQNHWEPLQSGNVTKVFALNPQSHRLQIDSKELKSYLKLLVIVAITLYIASLYFSIPYLYLGVLLQALNFVKLRGVLCLKPKFAMIKAKALVKGSPEEIGREIVYAYLENRQNEFDFMTIHSKEINRDEEKHIMTTDEVLDLPPDWLSRQFIQRRQMKTLTYWCQDDQGYYFVMRKSLPVQDKKYLTNVQEAFVCVPLESGKSLVYFFSEFNYGSQGPSVVVNAGFQDNVRLLRANVLGALVQFYKIQIERSLREVYQISKEVERQVTETRIFEREGSEDSKHEGINSQSSNQGGGDVPYRVRQNTRGFTEAGGSVKRLKENTKNIYVRPGQRLAISDRFPGYFRLENGALWCQNQDELNSQSGIFIEVIKRAGKRLMEGRGIVAVSLPVRIFEKRSMVERICDLWCTGPVFLRKAAIETLSNPVERMKYVVSFVISGMHQVASQRKPFNPILGETYEGMWPDGSHIYVEHISHHPPISCFQVEHVDSLFTFEGSYEYTAKVTDLGNSVTGRQVGKNRVKFADGSTIEWEYPFMKIQGLLFGKRTTHWIGGIDFTDKKHNITAHLEFSKEGGLFSRQSLPLDCLQGSIFKHGQEVCKVQGSWLEFLKFDDKLYWELETCDTIRPIAVDKCLPSDCRYREDSIVFATGDLDRAQMEKEILEELQRRDRKLREQSSITREKK